MAVARGLSTVITVNPAGITSTTYATGQCIGTINEIGPIAASPGGIVVLESVGVMDGISNSSKPAIDLIFFDRAPSTNLGGNAGSLVVNVADVPNIVGSFSIVTGDYMVDTSSSEWAFDKGIGLMMRCRSSAGGSLGVMSTVPYTHLWFIPVARATTPNYAAPTGLTFKLGFFQE